MKRELPTESAFEKPGKGLNLLFQRYGQPPVAGGVGGATHLMPKHGKPAAIAGTGLYSWINIVYGPT